LVTFLTAFFTVLTAFFTAFFILGIIINKIYQSLYSVGFTQIINAQMIPPIQNPASVNSVTNRTLPHPLSTTAKGGNNKHANTLQIDILIN
jgi:hypothetical protein